MVLWRRSGDGTNRIKIAMDEWIEFVLEQTMITQDHILSNNVWAKYEAFNCCTQSSVCSRDRLQVLCS
jgi:hypothetical protein